MKIAGNTFVVTGGTGGIGGAVARFLLGLGAQVVLFDVVPQDVGDSRAKEMTGDGKVKYIKVDITDSDSVKAAVQQAVEAFGKLVGCVHCAGIAVKRPWTNELASSISDFKKMLDVNTTGTFIVNAHIADAINAPYNKKGSDGKPEFFTTDEERGIIINFASAAAHGLYARTLAYGPSKVAVIGITKSMSDFLGPSGIRVCSVSPSIVASAMTANFSTYFSDDLLRNATFPRVPASPDDITPTIQYLIENKFLNGIDIQVDGGWRLVTSKPGVNGGPDPRELAPGLE